jgi:hypothetical protein
MLGAWEVVSQRLSEYGCGAEAYTVTNVVVTREDMDVLYYHCEDEDRLPSGWNRAKVYTDGSTFYWHWVFTDADTGQQTEQVGHMRMDLRQINRQISAYRCWLMD